MFDNVEAATVLQNIAAAVQSLQRQLDAAVTHFWAGAGVCRALGAIQTTLTVPILPARAEQGYAPYEQVQSVSRCRGEVGASH